MARSAGETGWPRPASSGEAAGALDVEKAEPASSITTSMDGASQVPGRRLSLSAAGHISLDDVEPVDVQLRDLTVTVDTSPSLFDPTTYPELFRNALKKTKNGSSSKSLLRSVDASLEAGSLTAILGGSGSGKTTLLNTVAERMFSNRLSQTGRVLFNKANGVHSIRHAYVMQQDVLLPTLTVRETLRYSADLRLPPPTTEEERGRIVEEVILELGLKECADTRIGDGQHRGCSGGEKRRVSIGVQLLSNPSVLFLDEPTTGLDATSAYQLVRTLKTLAKKGRTIITTIHQPRSEIWDLFDNLIVLSRGSPVFSGPIKDCIPWLSDMGYELPPFVNPAEFTIDHAAIDNRTAELEQESAARVERLKAAWRDQVPKRFVPVDVKSETENAAPSRKPKPVQHAGFFRQVRVLTDRTLKTTLRDPMGVSGSILEAILMAIICGYIFYDLPRDLPGIRSRQGALYTSVGLQGYLFLMFETYRLTIDIPTFDREHSEGCVTALPFILSRRMARFCTEDIPVPFLYSVIYYFMAGFDRDVGKFFTFFSIVLLNHYIAVCLAMSAVAAVRHFPGASLIGNLAYTVQSMACGYFVQSNTIPVYVRWLKYITYTYYAFGALCGNEFEGSFYDCPAPGGASSPECAQYTGGFIMENLGFPRDWVTRPIVIMFAFVVLLGLTAWLGLAFLKVEMTIARPRVFDTDLSAGKEKMSARSIHEVRAIDVGLDNFALGLDKRTLWGRKLPTKTILNPVTATFQAGMLNVIMGPSGSGKTSLLNAMALRLKNSLGTQYRPGGKLTFNGAVPSESVVESVVSYVCQDDDALLPSLTVRETLRFAAGLRLPSFMSKQEKNDRAEDVLLKMGLKDCADNLIGSDLVKGISGGEKRRVSIAVQVLTDPRVLLLDEPTSGLDAFTANSILEVLQGLAHEGRTLILTIHQARSDLFSHFGNVLLLARGGSPAYAGGAKDMLGYFGSLGHQCPQHTNPADYALDLITVDLQAEQREAESKEKVTRLLQAWEEAVRNGHSQSAARLSDIEEADEATNSKPTAKPATAGEEGSDAPGDGSRPSIEGPTSVVIPPPRQSFNRKTLSTPAELGALVRQRASFFTAFPILMHRAAINLRRQPPLLLARTMQVLGLAIVLALFFAPLKNDYHSVQNRVGFVQEVGAFYFVGMLQNFAVYPAEREVFYREDDDAVYGVEAFFMTYTVLELPLEILTSLVFGVLADLAVGFPRTAEMYFVWVFCGFAIVHCGESMGIMFNTVFSHTGFAVQIISVLLSVAQILSGIMSIDMPALFHAFNYLSPIRWATRALAPFSLRDIEFTCDDTQRKPNGECFISSGEQVLDLYKLNVDGTVAIIVLAGVVVAYRVMAWVTLRVARTRWRSVVEKRRATK